jgi:hypothetical protein
VFSKNFWAYQFVSLAAITSPTSGARNQNILGGYWRLLNQHLCQACQ